MCHMSFQARNLGNATKIYDTMLRDKNCTIILTLSGSLFSAGLKNVVCDLIKHNMIDVIISSGAIIVDQDFFEALGYKHYVGTCNNVDDEKLRKMKIDRIYDTFLDEDQLRICDMTISKIADSMEPRIYSSREFIITMGKYLSKNAKNRNSVVLEAYKKEIPIFLPAFSDCSAGFGLIYHQNTKKDNNDKVCIDSVKDFLELTKIKMLSKDTGLIIIGGGVPKNFAQDTTVACAHLGHNTNMHKYAI